jgi:shikimate kinase/3-dehydroquinate synthase
VTTVRPLVPPIVLLGPPGAGKSTVGPQLAARLGFSFVSLDERALAERFVTDGEARFRVREHLALRAALTDAPGGAVVIDAGAGIVDVDENLPLLERALCLVIDADADTSLARLVQAATPRPWLIGAGDPAAVLRTREAGRGARRLGLVAATGGAVVDASAPVDDVVTATVAAVAASRLPIAADPDVAESLQVWSGGPGRPFVIADPHVADVVEQAGVDVDLALHIAPLDKRLATVERILGTLVQAGVKRGDTIVAVGGGVLLDVVGLAAALHHRGTAWRAVPTTLLAMVDAALGGKTAVDIEAVRRDVDRDLDDDGSDGRAATLRIRNAAGALHPAASAHVWPGFLRSLDAEQVRQGRAEMLKHALLAADDLEPAVAGPLDAALLARSRGIKRAVVARDPDERHLRHALNLGHTVAHGLESGLGLAHGDAVLHGLRAMLWLSEQTAGLDVAAADAARAAIARLDPPPLPRLDDGQLRDLAAACRRDKKGGRLVLLRAPGEAVLADVDDSAVLAAVRTLW